MSKQFPLRRMKTKEEDKVEVQEEEVDPEEVV